MWSGVRQNPVYGLAHSHLGEYVFLFDFSTNTPTSASQSGYAQHITQTSSSLEVPQFRVRLKDRLRVVNDVRRSHWTHRNYGVRVAHPAEVTQGGTMIFSSICPALTPALVKQLGMMRSGISKCFPQPSRQGGRPPLGGVIDPFLATARYSFRPPLKSHGRRRPCNAGALLRHKPRQADGAMDHVRVPADCHREPVYKVRRALRRNRSIASRFR